MNLERRFGFFSLRVWGLILNFSLNAVALYGLAEYLADGNGLLWILIGSLGTACCIFQLSKPNSRGKA